MSPRRSTGWRSITSCSRWSPATTCADGGMAFVAECVEAIRARRPQARIETLISDAKGSLDSLATLFAARPDVLNHNVETVARLQRAVRPSAGYARSLSVLAHAKAAGLTTKSSIMVGPRRDRRRDDRGTRRSRRDRMRHRHDRPVPAPDVAPPPDRPMGRTERVRPVEADRRSDSGSATSRRARSPGRAITRSRPPSRSHPSASTPDPSDGQVSSGRSASAASSR